MPVLGMGKFQVCYWDFDGLLDLLVMEGHHTSLLGLAWFAFLGIEIQGVHQTEWHDFSTVCHEFLSVFDGFLGHYTGPPVSLQLNPQVRPIRLKARRAPFALKPG